MYNKKQFDKPFCGLTLTLYPTGKKSPSFEMGAKANSEFKCSLTKKFFKLSEVSNWFNLPEVRAYRDAGYSPKWGSRIVETDMKYGNSTKEELCFYMVKMKDVGTFKRVSVPPQYQQRQQAAQPQMREPEEDEWNDQF